MLNISFKKLHSTEIEFPDNNSPDDSKNRKHYGKMLPNYPIIQPAQIPQVIYRVINSLVCNRS